MVLKFGSLGYFVTHMNLPFLLFFHFFVAFPILSYILFSIKYFFGGN